jgi:hypothetical protein
MKSMAMVLAAVGALLALNGTAALSQEVCSKGYASCMDTCATKVSRGMQGSCMATCQQKNEDCSVKIFGARRVPAGTAQQQSSDPKDALAKEAAPVAQQPQPPAPRQIEDPAADQPAPRKPAHK